MRSGIQLPWHDKSAHWRSSGSAKWLQPQFMVLANRNERWTQPEQLLSEHHPALSPSALAGSTVSPHTGDRKCCRIFQHLQHNHTKKPDHRQAPDAISTDPRAPLAARNKSSDLSTQCMYSSESAPGQEHRVMNSWDQSWESYTYPSQRNKKS